MTTRRFGRAAGVLFAPLSFACALGCSTESAAPAGSPAQRRVVLPADAGAVGTSRCEPIHVAAIPSGCLGAWQCAEPNARELACVALDGGLACACAEGDASVRTTTDASCSSESDVTALARRLCGWEVP